MRALSKYLNRHSELGAAQMAQGTPGSFEHVLVVPAYDEDPKKIATLVHYCQRHNALLILVINAPRDAPTASRKRTMRLLKTPTESGTLVIDCVTQPIDPRHGVGLARKIGSDVAAHLISEGRVLKPWLYQTDADVTLPPNYFQQELPSVGTVIFAHQHHASDETLQNAAELYDRHMNYYIAGLRYAGSRYAYPSLGSTLAIHLNSYAAVHGFPKRNAGEDFHILNKLAKVAPIHFRPDVQILVEARLSTRVPFGTGPALKNILDLEISTEQLNTQFTSYHPGVFSQLQLALQQLEEFITSPDDHQFSPLIRDALTKLGWAGIAATLRDPWRNPSQRQKAVTDWFDALRTLRFVHLMQAEFPDQPLAESLATTGWEV